MAKSAAFGLVLVVAIVGTPAFGATVQSVKGQVSVNSGTGFKMVATGTETKAGDRVIVAPGGSAKLVYADGCTVEVRPGFILSVGAKSPCTAPYLAGLDYEPPQDPRFKFKPFIPLFGAGGAFLAYCLNTFCRDDDGGRRRPASP